VKVREGVSPADGERVRRRGVLDLLGIAGCIVILGWRIISLPGLAVCRDWAAILSLYSLYSLFSSESPRRTQVTLCAMAYLLAIYMLGQVPQIAAAWGWGR
jgi:hypothetical protein